MAKSKAKTIEKTEIKFPDRFKVIIWNDDHTPMDFVVQLLVELFDRPLKDAKGIMLAIHNEGKVLLESITLSWLSKKYMKVLLLLGIMAGHLNLLWRKWYDRSQQTC